jgi:hypothetical protein
LKEHVDAILYDRQRQHEQLRSHYDALLDQNMQSRAALHEHYDVLIGEIDKRYQARFLAVEQAVTTAFVAQEKAITAALLSAQAAVNKADLANEKRFDAVNEFRGQLGDQQRTLMPRAEAEALFKSLTDKIEVQAARGDRRDAIGAGGQQVWGYVAASVGVAVGIAGIVIGIVK